MSSKLKKLRLEIAWNQFEKTEIDFHDRVTILTGANGVGKSTLLRLISRTFSSIQQREVYNDLSVGDKKILNNILKLANNKGQKEYGPGYRFDLMTTAIPTFYQKLLENDSKDFGAVAYLDFEDAMIKLSLPLESINNNTWDYEFSTEIKKNNQNDWEYYSPKYENNYVNVSSYNPGVSISSHKSPYIYSKISYIPNGLLNKDDIFMQYLNAINFQHNISESYPDIRNPHEVIKQTIITMILYSSDSKYMINNKDVREELNNFVNLLKITLPKEIGFKDIRLDNNNGEIIFLTKTGNFLMDSLSSGMGSIIDIVWQLFMTVPSDREYFVLIDEIENHLHPSMQRDILPKLCQAFPNVQFIISTHSPFVVTSMEDSTIYVLDYNKNNRVEITKLEDYKYNLSMSNTDVLYNVLGVSNTIPIWAEKKFNQILSMYKDKNLTSDDQFEQLKSDMKEAKIDSLLSDLIFNINNSEDGLYGETTKKDDSE
ncbi:AAA family ATPase [Carnobacterium mobile]|uniref:AAA family ATPase n=1 Tax=Carnobacterium mobile TaxID=2750 RepID=UPI0018688AE1|nr:ATP-binding protein [Carnobacterium mobile]